MQHKSDSRRCSGRGSGNAIGRWLLSSVLLLLLGALTHALPITSKPIEGNAQRIAWDEWLRLPQEQKTQEKEKKVTAKSIFTLPFRQCPPGHKLYNERCIPLVNFDPTELLTQELLGLVGGGGDGAGGLNIGINGDDLIEQYDYDGDGDGDGDEAAMVFDEAYPLAVPSPSSSEKSVVQLPMEQLPPSDDAPLKFNIFEKKYPSDYSEVGGDGDGDASGSATADDATIEQLGSGGSGGGGGGGGNSTTTTNTTELESSTLLNSTDITTTTPTNDDLLALSTNYSYTSNNNNSNKNSSNFSFDDIQAIVLPASVVQAFPKNQMTPNTQLLKSDEDTVPMPAYSNSRATPTLSVYETTDDRSMTTTTTTMTSTLMTQMSEEDEAMKDATLEQNEATVELMKQTAIPLKDEHTRSITESSTNANSFEDSTKISSTLAQAEQSSALVAEDLTTNTISELVATATTTITELATKQQQENPTQMKSKTNIELKKSKVEPVAVTVDVVGSAGSVVADFMISSAESKADKTATTTTAATTTAATTTETAKVVAVDDSAAASASAHVSVSNVANRTLFDANVDAIIANDLQIRSDDRFYYQHLGVTQSDGNADGNDGGGDKSSATATTITTPSTTMTTTTTTSENEMMNTIVVGHIVDNEQQKDEPIKVFIIGDNENNNNSANKTEEINLEQKLREINELVKRGQQRQQQQEPPQQYAQSTTPTTPSIETNKISMLPIIRTPTITSEMPLVTMTNTATTTTTTAFADRDNNSLPATADEAAATTTPTILMSTVANSTTNVMPTTASTTASATASTTALPSSSPSSAATTTTTAATTTLSINSNRSNRNSKIIKINSLVETSTEPATTTTTIATTNLLKQETITSSTTTTTTSDTTNSSSSYQPFWWLPLGWRLDRSTDRSGNNQSFLMRFFTDFRLPRTTTTDMKIAKDSRGL